MTREEALSILKTFRITGDKHHEAFDMAIKALEKTNVTDINVGDLISRQAVRIALVNKGQCSKRYKLGETWELNLMEIEEALEELPSVEPEIEKCEDCINRKDIIKKLNNLCNNICEYSKKQRKSMCDACNLSFAFDMINNAKSVEPERKTGKWEYHSNGKAPIYTMNPEDAYCSCCGFHIDTTEVDNFDKYDFCPNCGAKMEVKT